MTKQNNSAVVKLAENIFSKWNESLQTNDPKKVAEMYSDDASFLPTLNGELKKGKTGAEEYFEHFLQKHPKGKVVESVAVFLNDENTILFSGLYDFEVDANDSKERTSVEARFTFIFQKKSEVADDWEITHHHSSLKP